MAVIINCCAAAVLCRLLTCVPSLCVCLLMCFMLPHCSLTRIKLSEMFILSDNLAVETQVLIKALVVCLVCMCVCVVCVCDSVHCSWKPLFFLNQVFLWGFAALGRPLTFHVTLAHSLSLSCGHKQKFRLIICDTVCENKPQRSHFFRFRNLFIYTEV